MNARHYIRSIITLLLLHCAPMRMRGQDLIITTAGDSLHCVITAVQEQWLRYSQEEDGRWKPRKIPLGLVARYQRAGHFPVDRTVKWNTSLPDDSTHRPLQWRVIAHGAWDYRTAPIGDDITGGLRDHLNALRSGLGIHASISAFPTRTVGAGAEFGIAVFDQLSDAVSYLDANDSMWTVALRDRITIGSIGPAIHFRSTSHNGFGVFHGSIAGTFTWYRDENSVQAFYLVYKGNTLGLTLRAGYDINLTRHLSFGIDAAFLSGAIERIEVDYGTGTAPVNIPIGSGESVRRLEFSAGFSFDF